MPAIGFVDVREFFRGEKIAEAARRLGEGLLKEAEQLEEPWFEGKDLDHEAYEWFRSRGSEGVPVLDKENAMRDVLGTLSPKKDHWIVQLAVPFSGNKDFFRYWPEPHPPYEVLGQIEGDRFLLFVEASVAMTTLQTDQALQSQLQVVEGYLDSIRKIVKDSVDAYTPRLVDAMRRRRAFFEAMRAFEAASVFKLKPRENPPPTYEPVKVKEKVVPAPVRASAPLELDPSLHEEHYKHILDSIAQMSRVVELAPKAFAQMGEEHLRFVLLVPLNMRYEGDAKAEAFSSLGKTDIHIQHQGASIFIGECKIWGGQKEYSQAIDQLLGYVTLRDTKTAIIIFNRSGEHTERFDAIKKATAAHANYVRLEKEEGTTLRYIMRSAKDSKKEFVMTVLVFDVKG